jgi:hypothetical protein
MNRSTTVSVMTAFLLLASGPAMADDRLQSGRGAQQRGGGLIGSIEQASGGGETSPSLPIEAPAQTTTQAPAVAPALPSPSIDDQAPPLDIEAPEEAPSLGPIGDAPLGDVSASPEQALPATVAAQQGPLAQAEGEKKPGFFKRTWTKVKSFFGNMKDKVKGAVANMKAKREERRAAKAAEKAARAQAASSGQQVSVTPVTDLYLGGGDGASGGDGAAE